MDLNKAFLCGRLQQTGLGWAPGTSGSAGSEAQAGEAGSAKDCGRKKERCPCLRPPCLQPAPRPGPSVWPSDSAQSRLSFQPRPRLPPPPSCPWASPHLPSLSCQKTLSKMQTVQALAGLKFLSRSNLLSVALTLSPAHLLGQRMSC